MSGSAGEEPRETCSYAVVPYGSTSGLKVHVCMLVRIHCLFILTPCGSSRKPPCVVKEFNLDLAFCPRSVDIPFPPDLPAATPNPLLSSLLYSCRFCVVGASIEWIALD